MSPTVNPPQSNEKLTAAENPQRKGGRERILHAASKLFLSKGYSATSTRDIAEAAGIRQPSLYHHFATKADILHAVVLATVEPSLVKARLLSEDQSLTMLERLMALVDFDVRLLWASDRSSSAFALVAQGTDGDLEDPLDRFGELQGFYHEFIRGASHEWGDLRSEELIGVIFSLIEGVVFRRAYEKVAVDEVSRQTQAAVVRLLVPPKHD